jgi:hypothetical protein
MRVLDRLAAAPPLGVGMDEARLDGTGTDERDLDDDVVEPVGLGVDEARDLGARLDLEGA